MAESPMWETRSLGLTPRPLCDLGQSFGLGGFAGGLMWLLLTGEKQLCL